MRLVPASKETAFHAKHSPAKMVKIYSFFPCDQASCECAQMIKDFKQRMKNLSPKEQQQVREETKFLECPRVKRDKNLQRFEIRCKKCKQIQGYCYASNPNLTDWCDFHYVAYTKGDYWYGNYGTHISPITEELCLECTCGTDTRDFRANVTLSPKVVENIEKKTKIGRQYNKPDSKFLVTKVS